ncbi:hypothetical protein B0H14DRAFT_3738559 [Mycena olivaceomarginata]|nr:hypothetical protein B0H14DRAFT_3738559 [Mycena olivaceomarginata]
MRALPRRKASTPKHASAVLSASQTPSMSWSCSCSASKFKHILVVVIKCDTDDHELRLRDEFERYNKIPMRDGGGGEYPMRGEGGVKGSLRRAEAHESESPNTPSDWARFIAAYACGRWDPQRIPRPLRASLNHETQQESTLPIPKGALAFELTCVTPPPPSHCLRSSFSTVSSAAPSPATSPPLSLPGAFPFPPASASTSTTNSQQHQTPRRSNFSRNPPLGRRPPEHELTDPMRGAGAVPIPGSHPELFPSASVSTSNAANTPISTSAPLMSLHTPAGSGWSAYNHHGAQTPGWDIMTPGGTRRSRLSGFWSGTANVDSDSAGYTYLYSNSSYANSYSSFGGNSLLPTIDASPASPDGERNLPAKSVPVPQSVEEMARWGWRRLPGGGGQLFWGHGDGGAAGEHECGAATEQRAQLGSTPDSNPAPTRPGALSGSGPHSADTVLLAHATTTTLVDKEADDLTVFSSNSSLTNAAAAPPSPSAGAAATEDARPVLTHASTLGIPSAFSTATTPYSPASSSPDHNNGPFDATTYAYAYAQSVPILYDSRANCYEGGGHDVLTDDVLNTEDVNESYDMSLHAAIEGMGVILQRREQRTQELEEKAGRAGEGWYYNEDKDEEEEKPLHDAVEVHWVTKITELNRVSSTYVTYGNDASHQHVYGNAALFVHVPAFGEGICA